MMNKLEWVGTKTDWEGFEKAQIERWETVSYIPHGTTTHCKLHNTYFDPVGTYLDAYMDAEPCWQCWDEFQVKL